MTTNYTTSHIARALHSLSHRGKCEVRVELAEKFRTITDVLGIPVNAGAYDEQQKFQYFYI